MSLGSVFINNRTQSVRLPVDKRFPEDIKKVFVRVNGKDRILSPASNAWDSFFLSDETKVSDDFLTQRASQQQEEREAFD